MAAAGAATLESHEREPYRMLVELNFSDDPVFTDFLKKAVARELRDQLSNFFGELAEVEVGSEGRLWGKLGSRPLADLAADRLPATSAAIPWDKAFLVRIEWESGIYRILWRQLSLEARYVGPLYSRQTADRHWLAKAICLAVRDDFAPVALVSVRGDEVDLKFRGAAFRSGTGSNAAPRLAAWLKDRTLLQPLKASANRDGSLARTPISHTVITLEPGNYARGRIVTPWVDPLRSSAHVVGFQAIKLTTQKGSFGIRVVNAETGDPVATCSVYASSDKFSTEATHAFHPTVDGWVAPLAPFEHAAYITISQTGGSSFKFILPITAERCTLECRVRIDELAGGKSDLHRKLRYASQDVQVLHAAIDLSVREVNRLHEAKRYEEALKRARTACDEAAPQASTLKKAVAEMKTAARKLQVPDSFFAATEQQVADLGTRLDSLRATAENLDQMVNSIDLTNKANVLTGLADNAAKALDFGEAIAKYDEALRELEKLPKEYAEQQKTRDQVARIRQVRDELKRAWDRNDPDLVKARAFVSENVLKAKVRGIQAVLPKARDALKTIQRYDDHLTARILVKALDDVLLEILEMVDVLEGRGGREDLADLQRYNRLSEEVSAFRQEIARWLEGRRSGGQAGASPEQRPAPDREKPPRPDSKAAPSDEKGPPSKDAPPPESGKPPSSSEPKPPPKSDSKKPPEVEEEPPQTKKA